MYLEQLRAASDGGLHLAWCRLRKHAAPFSRPSMPSRLDTEDARRRRITRVRLSRARHRMLDNVSLITPELFGRPDAVWRTGEVVHPPRTDTGRGSAQPTTIARLSHHIPAICRLRPSNCPTSKLDYVADAPLRPDVHICLEPQTYSTCTCIPTCIQSSPLRSFPWYA